MSDFVPSIIGALNELSGYTIDKCKVEYEDMHTVKRIEIELCWLSLKDSYDISDVDDLSELEWYEVIEEDTQGVVVIEVVDGVLSVHVKECYA